VGRLFADDTAPQQTILEQPEQMKSIWMDFSDRDKAQRSIFSPADKAFMHQMIPTCHTQVG